MAKAKARRRNGVLVPGLRRARTKAGLTQGGLAEKAGVERATVVHLEGGNRAAQPLTIKKLADALGVEPSRLTAEAEDPEKALLALITGKADEVRAAVEADEITTEMALRAQWLHEDIERYAGPMSNGPIGQAMDDLWSVVMEGYNASVRLAAGKEAEVRSMNSRSEGGQRGEVKQSA